jgi:probable rRNA maturation factor
MGKARPKATSKPAKPATPVRRARRPLRVDWSDMGPVRVPKPKALADLVAAVLKAEGRQGTVNLVFCPDSEVRRLNRQFRNLDKVTDVLSFHYGEDEAEAGEVWGEIYIASLQAKKQAPRWKNTFFNELRRLAVHGALHLAGYDHMKAPERLIMRAKEDHYLTHGK